MSIKPKSILDQDREMKVEMMDISLIEPYENNPRFNEASVDAVAESIRRFGWKQPIVVDSNHVIIAGHTRYKAAKKLGMMSVPVLIADDLTDEEVKAYRLADNKVGEQSLWDFQKLDEELDGILDIDMGDFGFSDLSEVVESPAEEDITVSESSSDDSECECPRCHFRFTPPARFRNEE